MVWNGMEDNKIIIKQTNKQKQWQEIKLFENNILKVPV